jgi:hypothetical protein
LLDLSAEVGQPLSERSQASAQLPDEGAPRDYFALLRRWWGERRWDEICQLTGNLTGRGGAAELSRVATLCQAIDDAAVADAPRLKQYHSTWQRLSAGSDIERQLVDRLGQMITVRLKALEREGFAKRGEVAATVLPREAKVGAG